MQTLVPLCTLLLLLFSAQADVVDRFEGSCSEFFYNGKVPEWGASTNGAVRLCQRYDNKFHFATLYDTKHRIAVYSAYVFKPPIVGSGREKYWFIEPQLVNKDWKAEMQEGKSLEKDHPGIELGEKQAVDEDYKGSGFDRGHLNPNGHHSDTSRSATFTLTNVVPQNPTLNQKAWNTYEGNLAKKFASCSKAFVLVGAVPSKDTWIVKNNVKRVNIPDFMWNAYCCVDNNGKPKGSGAATAKNSEANVVNELSLDELIKFLQTSDKALFDGNCKA